MGLFDHVWTFRKTIIIVLAPLVLMPLPLAFPTKAIRCAYAVLLMAVYWMTEALPIAVTALLPIVLMPLLGVATSNQICINYLKDTNFLFFGGLVVALAVERWNLHKRIALRVLMFVGAQPKWLMCGFMSTTAFISMWLSNTATTAMMVPIAEAVLGELEEHREGLTTIPEDLTVDDAFESPTSPTATTTMGTVENGIGHRGRRSRHSSGVSNGIVEVKTPVDQDVPDVKVKDSTTMLPMETEEGEEKEQPTRRRRHRSSVFRHDETKPFTGMCKAICLCICYAANIGGFATLTGTGPNLVMKGQMDTLYGNKHGINFSSWFIYAFPTMFLCLVLAWVWLQIYFLGPKSVLEFRCASNTPAEIGARNIIRREYEKLGPMDFAEGAVLVHFILLAMLWFTREPAFMPGWSRFFEPGYVTDACVGMTVSVSLFIFPSRLPNFLCFRSPSDQSVIAPAPPLLDWDSMKGMAWGVILVLGGGFALADACKISGLSELIGNAFISMNIFSPMVLVLILCVITSFFTEITSNIATATIFIPIMAELAEGIHVNPLYLVMPITICTSVAFMLPVATPPNAIVFAYDRLKIIDMVRAGLVLKLFCLLVLFLSINTWGFAYFDLGTYPLWAGNPEVNGQDNITGLVATTVGLNISNPGT